MPRTTIAECEKALRRQKGIIAAAAKNLGIARETLQRKVGKHPRLRKACDEALEEMKDLAEGKLYQNIMDGKESSIHYFLRTQAKDRGYTERSEVTGKDGGAIVYEDTAREFDSRMARLIERAREE